MEAPPTTIYSKYSYSEKCGVQGAAIKALYSESEGIGEGSSYHGSEEDDNQYNGVLRYVEDRITVQWMIEVHEMDHRLQSISGGCEIWITVSYDTDDIWLPGLPICVSTWYTMFLYNSEFSNWVTY